MAEGVLERATRREQCTPFEQTLALYFCLAALDNLEHLSIVLSFCKVNIESLDARNEQSISESQIKHLASALTVEDCQAGAW